MITIQIVGGGCRCKNANNHRHQVSHITGVSLPDMPCIHSYDAAPREAPRVKAKRESHKTH